MRDRIRFFMNTEYWTFIPQAGRAWYGWWFWWLCFHCHVTTYKYQLKDKE